MTRRRHLSADRCMALSLEVQERFLASGAFDAAQSLALYSPILNECFTERVFERALARSKKVCYPRIGPKGDLEFAEVADRGELVPGTFGILEPSGERLMRLSELDLVVVPGVAFDLSGHRLGYGKGFYDRVLGAHGRPGILAGFAFEMQLIDAIPAEEHDVHMDMVITEERILGCHGDPGQTENN